MKIKKLISDRKFNLEGLKRLKINEFYAFLILDQVIFINLTEKFLKKFEYTMQYYLQNKIDNHLTLSIDKVYVNDKEQVDKAKELISKKSVDLSDEILLFVDIYTNKETLFSLLMPYYLEEKAELNINEIINENKTIKKEKYNYRKLEMNKLADDAKAYLDSRVNHRAFVDFNSKYFPAVGVEFNTKKNYIESGFGRSSNYHDSFNIAYLEAVERLSSQFYAYKNEDKYGSYNELKEEAIKPSEFILASSKRNKFIPYTDDLKIYWTKAESIREKSTKFIPEQISVFGDSFFRNKEKMNRYIYDSSNGVSLGGSYAEAVFHGLLELIERDNFLTTWYGKIPANQVNWRKLNFDNDFKTLLKEVTDDGYEVHLFDTTMELAIPSYWALIINRNKDCHMFAYNAAGCHPVEIQAAKSALLEAIVGITIHEENNKINGKKQLDDVTEFEDHVNYYNSSVREEDFNFALKQNNNVENRKQFGNRFSGKTIEEDLGKLFEKILELYKDVYVVNLTSKSMQEKNLYVVKVIVPGMLPMTFGTQNERYDVERIKKERERRGLSTEYEKNIAPHPFP
ncbi:YcaO-like family protein [Bacillus cereus]|uniref:SagD family bacteriocin biosynthesis docking scaffold n=1 Tax=Bacillus cereus HuA4-10 TaxID=1053206 RepID=J8DA66_BACCE|nr:YcaO-like family protein [Bacillus cereus]EJQ73119.1 SagD family bacteriocin biosynthesis docking scaffold [Bacillus cereus HuA4-10]